MCKTLDQARGRYDLVEHFRVILHENKNGMTFNEKTDGMPACIDGLIMSWSFWPHTIGGLLVTLLAAPKSNLHASYGCITTKHNASHIHSLQFP